MIGNKFKKTTPYFNHIIKLTTALLKRNQFFFFFEANLIRFSLWLELFTDFISPDMIIFWACPGEFFSDSCLILQSGLLFLFYPLMTSGSLCHAFLPMYMLFLFLGCLSSPKGCFSKSLCIQISKESCLKCRFGFNNSEVGLQCWGR